jgi:hypothetical protein
MLLGGLPNHQTTPINTTTMSKKRHTKEAQIKAIRDHESGRSQAEICKELNITAQTFYRWKKQLGMMTNPVIGDSLWGQGSWQGIGLVCPFIQYYLVCG